MALTALVCTAGHVYFWLNGSLHSQFQHYLAGLSEAAIVICAMLLHRGEVGDKALHLKLDGLVRGVESVSDDLTEIEELPEEELDSLRSDLRGD